MSALDTRFDSDGFPVVLSAAAPPRRVIAALEAGVVNITRRVEICESDGVTLWKPNDIERLVDGTVTVDYNSDERRKLDLTLDNTDNLLRPDPYGGFWYDKILKPFRGVRFKRNSVPSPVAIVESANVAKLAGILFAADLTAVDDKTAITLAGEVAGYEYIVSENYTATHSKMTQLVRLWNNGQNIITIGHKSGTDVPLYSTTSALGAGTQWGVAQPNSDSPTQGRFVSQASSPTAAGTGPTAVVAGVTTLALWPNAGSPVMITSAIRYSPAGGVWLDLHLPNLDSLQSQNLLAAAVRFIESDTDEVVWETQLGEFMIDNINADNFPLSASVTCRDYTKKLMNDKIDLAETFVAGTSLKEFVQDIAAGGGILFRRMRLSVGNELLQTDLSFDRGTDRWTMLKQAINAYNYEMYFDAFGTFVVRPFFDPSTTPVSWSFNTGARGNLVSFSRSTNDSRVYNSVVVYSDPADSSQLPYFGKAEITDVTSPVHWTKIGKRSMPPIVTSLLGSDAEAVGLAQQRLKIAALESYELNYSSIYYPWLEVGEIIDIADPAATVNEPSRFLLDSLSLPLGLGAMSSTGKRVTFVGSAGGVGGTG